MTINEALDYIHAVDWRRSSLGLRRIDELLAQMGHPERTMKFVHVTGTNGKGSTCAILASLLRAAGFSCCEAVDSIAGATFLRGRK